MESSYHEKLEKQETIINQALVFLFANKLDCLNELDRQFIREFIPLNKLSPLQQYTAFKRIKKYWRQLKKADPPIILPSKYLPHYSLDEKDGKLTVHNLSKKTEYIINWIGDDELSCTCKAYAHGNECGHIKFALEILNHNENINPVIPMSELISSNNSNNNKTLESIELLPGIIATPDQSVALRHLMEFASGEKSIHGLFGFSGTGKSLLLQGWIKSLRTNGYDAPIVFTAPTNKAVNVLQSMVNKWQLEIECHTCAKLLGLKPKIDLKNGEQYFDVEFNGECSISDYSIVVVDECSMVGSAKTHKGLWEYLTETAGLFTKLLFVGDYAQLPPINEPISKVFIEVNEPSMLTQVQRYRGAIASIASNLRENLNRKSEPYFETNYTSDGTEGLFNLNESNWMSACIKAFSSEKYLTDPNYARCIAWTNKRVTALNTAIRSSIRGPSSPRFVEGERLIATEHFFRKEFGAPEIIWTSQEMEVIEAMEGTLGNFECWYLSVQLFDWEGTKMMIPVLHERSFKDFQQDQQDLKNSKQWRLYYEQKQKFVWLDYAYAITAHKSQGSTFHNVFVDVADICKNNTRNKFTWPGPNGKSELIWERNQLLYVALTRASHRVFVYE